MDKAKGKQAELKKLSEIHQRLETWRRELPKELEPKEGGLPSMLVMHMFFQLLYIHLFRPFLKYNPKNSPLPAHVSPRKLCTQAAAMISKLLRLYKRSHGLRQICNIVVYIAHSACTIHLLNLPEKNAKRDIIHGAKHLEEIAEGWLCARRTLGILSVLARRWKVDLPDEAATVLARTDSKFGPWTDVTTPKPVKRDSLPEPEQKPAVDVDVDVDVDTSPAFQPYGLSLANTASQFFDRTGNNVSMSAMQNRTTEAPPIDAIPTYTRAQRGSLTHSVATPVSTNGTPSTQGASPSQLFGGVEQLIREGQDWWLRDQNQLAFGFDNWNHGIEDMAGWFTGQGGVVGSPTMVNPGVAAAVAGAGDVMNGGPVVTNGNGVVPQGMNGGGGAQGVFGAGLNAYNEQEWYQ
ncbi:uncharacterized protein N0V89_006871 [Didymosphaeria variabile]|uniref:Transcription factor domain-containing protein n=1 Tax=Didymosphaeria variabile TaxID=1932322 RepID=A0A9W8XJY9_9PLEO|nr:uncharacterized protein N0V89_006871 [Didymosphaeria variabile]KAJ4351528.1 hypothetical protein N0V89_006871 [Didymosphaeria variabile]